MRVFCKFRGLKNNKKIIKSITYPILGFIKIKFFDFKNKKVNKNNGFPITLQNFKSVK